MKTAREQIFAGISPRYSGVRHFLLVNSIALLAIATAATLLRSPAWWELLAVPIAFVFANAVEWQLHKDVLHKRVPGLGLIYQRHALTHHAAFHHDTMSAPSSREWRWVLFPAPLIVFIVGFSTGVAALLWRWGRNGALLIFMTFIGFYLLYEWCHLAYHQPPDSRVGRLRLVQVLRRHHQQHHHPALAKRYNFNITFPLWDWVRGTMARLKEVDSPGQAD